jgi:hypothetical protein
MVPESKGAMLEIQEYMCDLGRRKGRRSNAEKEHKSIFLTTTVN